MLQYNLKAKAKAGGPIVSRKSTLKSNKQKAKCVILKVATKYGTSVKLLESFSCHFHVEVDKRMHAVESEHSVLDPVIELS